MKKRLIASLTAILLVLFSVMPTSLASSKKVTKEENVYVVTDADGNVSKKIVSDTLKNTTKGEKISDKSGLSNIENISGDEKFKKSSLTKNLTWNSDGKDITYQGTTNKDLPVDIDITYTLDGNVVSSNELAGKSGKLTIRYDYSSSNSSFVAVTGLMIDTDKLSNVKVTNGKTIQEGDSTIIVGYALPGLKSALGLSGVDIPSYFEVTANVKDFETQGSMSYVTNEVFSDLDLSSVDSAMDLVNSINKLSSSSELLVSGSDQLYEGINTLVSKTGTLSTGVKKLDNGGKKLASGSKAIKSGAEEIQKGSSDLTTGLKTADSGATSLKTKMKSVGDNDVNKAITGLKDVNSADSAALNYLKSIKTDNLDDDSKKALNTAIAYLSKSVSGQSDLITGTTKLKYALTTEGHDTDGNATTLYSGISDLESGISSAQTGSEKITSGTNKLIKEGIDPIVSGSKELSEGLSTLQKNSGKLISGIKKLQSGSKELKDGMSKFNSQGIQKLVSAAGSVQNLKTRLHSVVNSSKNYNNFSGISSDMNGSVKFVYKSSSIEKSSK